LGQNDRSQRDGQRQEASPQAILRVTTQDVGHSLDEYDVKTAAWPFAKKKRSLISDSVKISPRSRCAAIRMTEAERG
jgi:hypothetical protein